MSQKVFLAKNSIWLSKNKEFDADFESDEKVASKIMQNSYQRIIDSKMEFLNYITVCKNFCL